MVLEVLAALLDLLHLLEFVDHQRTEKVYEDWGEDHVLPAVPVDSRPVLVAARKHHGKL